MVYSPSCKDDSTGTEQFYERVRRAMRENGGVLGTRLESAPQRTPRTTLIVGIVGELRDPFGKVVGSARAGKDTAAQAIIDRFSPGLRVKRVALADALKVEVYDWLRLLGFYWHETDMFNDDLSVINYLPPFPEHQNIPAPDKIEWINERKGIFRNVLQKHGTQLRRNEDSQYWIDRLLAEVDRLGAQVVLVPDVRFANECDICHATLKVVRPVAAANPTTSQHVSETELAGHVADFAIMNDGDLGQLAERSCETFEKLISKFHVQ